MAETITHEGIVIAINDSHITVSIQSQSACAACHAKGACGLSEVTHKNITAEKPNTPVKVGDKVIVMASVGNALYSVLFAYFLPSVVLIAILALLISSGIEETWAALYSLLTITIYFIIIYFFRNRFAQKIKFKVKIE
ncbi:SoxR reducing system RseC family protein [Gabonibacter chumensis]|uniref:SoxR reducing system RseC family protein n=1 Tax=Gabonibacter chumensis TaxID=2972474 RepID=UPI0025740FAA|nr:SoxR reducing system RseC family protein [Gabonibacter chumensis]MCR9013336.1 SoxR reducing system RseC family protein [Gabonibacter chumensis]